MKKILISVLAVLLAAVSITSCTKNTWIDNFEEGKKLAEESKKGIFLDICSKEDEVSERLEKLGFGNEQFLKKFGKDFVFVKLDLTDRLNAENLGPNATNEERAAAEKIIVDTKNAVGVAEKYAVKTLPSMFVLTKEGYVVSLLEFYSVRADFDPNATDADKASFDDIFEIDEMDAITKKIDDAAILLKDFDNNLKIAKSSASVETRVAAVNEIFDSTDFVYRYLIRDLSELVIEIDIENSTGAVPKHILSVASAQAVDAGENYSKAAEVFENAATKKFLTKDDRQLLYYQAAIAHMRSGNYLDAKNDVQKSIDAAPESEQIDLLNAMLENIEMQIKPAE